MTRFQNKTVVVTGASAGIGFAAAQLMASEGAHVYITGRREKQLAEAAEQIGPRATAVRADITDLADLDALYAKVAEDGRTIDAVVANAGGGGTSPLAEVTLEHFESVVAMNLKGTLFAVQKALPLLNEGASVVLLSSIAGEKGYPGFSVYSATKAGVRSFARTWAAELKDRGIRVNTITPGTVHTDSLEGVSPDPEQRQELFASFASMIPLGRLGEPDEVAHAIAFLASPQSSFINGSVLYLDGGQSQV